MQYGRCSLRIHAAKAPRHRQRSNYWEPLRCLFHLQILSLLCSQICFRCGTLSFQTTQIGYVHISHARYQRGSIRLRSSLYAGSRTNISDDQKEQAGVGGYSIMRQPLDWGVTDEESDGDEDGSNSVSVPRFDVPEYLDETKEESQQINANWFNSRRSVGTLKDNQEEEKELIVDREDFYNLKSKGTSESTDGKDVLDRYALESGSDVHGLNLHERTMDALDYRTILNALQNECGTLPAKDIIKSSMFMYSNQQNASQQGLRSAKKHSKKYTSILSMGLTAQSVDEVQLRYDAIREMNMVLDGKVIVERERSNNAIQNQRASMTDSIERKKRVVKVKLGQPPVTNNEFNTKPLWDKIDEGKVLDGPDILEMSTILNACKSVASWCSELERAKSSESKGNREESRQQKKIIQLPRLGQFIYVDAGLRELLSEAFDDDGNLSGITFPEIGRLRAKVQMLKRNIIGTLDNLLAQSSLKSKVSMESGGALYSEVNGRIVIPIAESQEKSVSGIAHVYSRSKKTAYVEPTEIVGPTNEMRQAELELKREESRVWRMLTSKILEHRDDIESSVTAVAQIDLVMARIRLGRRLEGVIPLVKDEGIISLQNAKHPVLLLRELDNVVGSDLMIGNGTNQAIVLTGPNSGGKTVVLKLMGLMCFMARDGIPVPAGIDARVDYFDPILADIGDIQSLDGDLSTFSGHMLVCREVLSNAKKNALVLMDELGSGTDPKQGVAIAQAILEAIMATGARVAVTTHYMELKQLASFDNRFKVGGMEFKHNKPTYRLVMGVIGESFALSVAERLHLPIAVIERAKELLDTETRQMVDLLKEIENQKETIDKTMDELEVKREEMYSLEQDMKKQKEAMEKTKLNIRRTEANKFSKKLEQKEEVLEQILQTLKSDPSKKVIARSWEEIKYIKREAFKEAEDIPSVLRKREDEKRRDKESLAALTPISMMKEKPNIQPGDKLIIVKQGVLEGKEASVVNMKGKQVNVSVGTGGMTMTMKLADVSLPLSSSKGTTPQDALSSNLSSKGISKMARKALADEALDSDKEVDVMRGPKKAGTTMRLKSNTVDVLGCNFEAARRRIEDKFSKTMTQKDKKVWILHGHGTGVLKQKIRNWLKTERQFVKTWKAADDTDGGDAFTMVEVKSLLM